MRRTVVAFVADGVPQHAAAVAFFALLSLAPIFTLGLSATAALTDDTTLVEGFKSEAERFAAGSARDALLTLIEHAQREPLTSTGAILSLAILLFAGSGVFHQLQMAMNAIWGAEQQQRGPVAGFLHQRLLSLLMLLAVGLLMLVSLTLTTILRTAVGWLPEWISELPGMWLLINAGVSIVVFGVLVALVFRLLPNVEIAWRDVLTGGLFTAVLLVAGREIVGAVIAGTRLATAYGAASSLVIVLLWIYYGTLILFLGAEFTQVWARERGRAIRPAGEVPDRGEQRAAAEAKGYLEPGAEDEESGADEGSDAREDQVASGRGGPT